MNKPSIGRIETDYRDEEAQVLPVVLDLIQNWRFLLRTTVLATGVALGVSLLIPAQYTATTSLLPEQRSGGGDNLAGLAGIASQLGVGFQTGAQSPQLYADLLALREVLSRVLISKIPTTSGTDSVRILDLIVDEGGDEASRLELGVNRLRSRIATRMNTRTGLISIDVDMGTPTAAASVARRTVEVLQFTITQMRQSQAAVKRRFSERRLRDVEDSLDLAEKRTRAFLELNREFRTSPNLTFEYEHLQRQISVYQSLYSQIRGQYEASRITEANDTPVLYVIDEAVEPVKRSSPRLVRAMFTGFVLGALVSIGVVLLRVTLQRMRDQNPESLKRLREAFSDVFRRTRGSETIS